MVRIDGDAKAGPGPFDLLLCATAACASTDIVSMLEGQHTPLTSLDVRIESTRVTDSPRRLASAVLRFTVRGANITKDQAERVVSEALTKYCGVRASLTAEANLIWTVLVG
jgi:putative redox protein